MTFLCVTCRARINSCLKRRRISGFPAKLRPNDLESHKTLELAIPHFVNCTHSAFTQTFENFVAFTQHAARLDGCVGAGRAGLLNWDRPASCAAHCRFESLRPERRVQRSYCVALG